VQNAVQQAAKKIQNNAEILSNIDGHIYYNTLNGRRNRQVESADQWQFPIAFVTTCIVADVLRVKSRVLYILLGNQPLSCSFIARNVSCCVALFSLILTQINSIAYSARQREIVSHDIVLVIRAFMAYIWSILERNSVTWLP